MYLALCTAALGLSALVARLARGGPVHPALLWSVAWFLAAAASQGGLVRLQPIPLGSQLVLGLGVLSFPLGCLVALAMAGRGTPEPARPARFPPVVLLGLAALAFAGFALQLYLFSQKASLLVYLATPERVETIGFQLPGVGYLNLVHIVLPALLLLQARRAGGAAGAWRLLALLSLLTTPFAGNKSYFMQAALGAAVALLLDLPRIGTRRLVVSGVSAAALLLGFFAFYDHHFKEESGGLVDAGVVRIDRDLAFLGRPLLYFAGPSAAFGPFTQFHDDVYHGRASFRPVSKLVSRMEPMRIPPMNAAYYGIPMPFNTYTAFREPWSDAREAGVVAFGFSLGLASQFLWVHARRRRSPPLLALCGFVGAALLFSPFVGFLVNPKSAFFALLLLGLHQLARQPGGEVS